ncbi:hypothetical protein PG994_010023 [Apiospora phragmitis]|uniref:Uncharacterized protein n=1 Tax=Apiospora phragmitis TaxID=2905665 RepID=A0ABR1TNX0_9PEZI
MVESENRVVSRVQDTLTTIKTGERHPSRMLRAISRGKGSNMHSVKAGVLRTSKAGQKQQGNIGPGNTILKSLLGSWLLIPERETGFTEARHDFEPREGHRAAPTQGEQAELGDLLLREDSDQQRLLQRNHLLAQQLSRVPVRHTQLIHVYTLPPSGLIPSVDEEAACEDLDGGEEADGDTNPPSRILTFSTTMCRMSTQTTGGVGRGQENSVSGDKSNSIDYATRLGLPEKNETRVATMERVLVHHRRLCCWSRLTSS